MIQGFRHGGGLRQQMMQQRPMGEARSVGPQQGLGGGLMGLQQAQQGAYGLGSAMAPQPQFQPQQMQQQFNPQMQQQMFAREQMMQQQAQQQITPQMENEYGTLQAQMQKEREMQRANPAIGMVMRSPQEEKLLQTFRTARPPPPQPGMLPSPGWASTFGQPQMAQQAMAAPPPTPQEVQAGLLSGRFTEGIGGTGIQRPSFAPLVQQQPSTPSGYAQPPSPPPPSVANAPRPQQLAAGPIQQQPTQLQPQPTQTESGDWGSGSPNAGGGAGGPPTSWKMSIEPMAYGGMIPRYHSGGSIREHTHGRGPDQHLPEGYPGEAGGWQRSINTYSSGFGAPVADTAYFNPGTGEEGFMSVPARARREKAFERAVLGRDLRRRGVSDADYSREMTRDMLAPGAMEEQRELSRQYRRARPHSVPQESDISDRVGAEEIIGDMLSDPKMPYEILASARGRRMLGDEFGEAVVDSVLAEQKPSYLRGEPTIRSSFGILRPDLDDAEVPLWGDVAYRRRMRNLRPMNRASGGIIGLRGGGEVPMVLVDGEYIPAYWPGGGLFKKLKKGLGKVGKLALKAAPVAAMFIPGIGPVAAGAIGGITGALSKKIEGGSWGDSLSQGIMTGMASAAGRKAVQGIHGGFTGRTAAEAARKAAREAGGNAAVQEKAYRDALNQFAGETNLWGRAGSALEGLSGAGGALAAAAPFVGGLGQAGGGGGGGGGMSTISGPAQRRGGDTTGAPGGLGWSSEGMFPAGAASEYDYRTTGAPRRPNAAGGLYASRHFGGGPIPEYRRGRKVKKKKKQRRGRRQPQRRAAPAAQRYGRTQLRQRPAMPREEFEGEEEFMRPAVMPPPPTAAMQPAVMPPPPVAPPVKPGGLLAPPVAPPVAPAVVPVAPTSELPPPKLLPQIQQQIPQTYADAIMEDGEFDEGPPQALPQMIPARSPNPLPIPAQMMNEDDGFGDTGGPGPSPPPTPAPIAPQIQEQIPQTYAEMEDGEFDEGGGERSASRSSRFAGRGGTPDLPYVVDETMYDMEFDEGEQEFEDAREEVGPASIYGLNQGPGNNVNVGAEDRFAGRGGLPDLPYVVDEPLYGTEDSEFDEGEQEFEDAKETAEDPAVQAAKDAAAAQAVKDAAAAKAAKDAAAAQAAQAAKDAKAAKDAAAAQQTTTPPPMASPFAGGFDPNAMPTTAAQFTQAGNPAAAAMLGRINQAPVIQDYTTQSVAGGGVIEESAGEDVIPNQILEEVSKAVMNGDEETVMAFRDAVVPDIFSPQEFDQLMDQIQSDIMSRQQGPPVGPSVGPPMQVGGLIPGNGDAMADDIVTMADEGTSDAQKIAISSGEYVVAGDVVSGLGSGNTDAGAEVLDQLQDDVRIDRTGTPQQPPPMNLSEVLPATYGDRYAQ